MTVKRRRVIVRFRGGLGNQLFQFSAGYALSTRLNAELVLDATTGFLRDRYKRKFVLHRFGVTAPYASTLDIVLTQMKRVATRELGPTEPLHSSSRSVVLRDHDDLRAWHQGTAGKKQRLILDGHWQDPGLFEDSYPALREILNIESLTATSPSLRKLASDQSTVAMHFRNYERDDPDTTLDLDLDYYRRAFLFLTQQIERPSVLLVSNSPQTDLGSIRRILPRHTQVLAPDCGDDLEHFALLSLCSNVVIANSSFSWWAAWLGHERQKSVVYPLPRGRLGQHDLPRPLQLSSWHGE